MKKILFICTFSVLAGCATPQPQEVDNVCAIFRQYPAWYWATQDVEKKWHMPISVQMAIIRQESCFLSNAQPERTKLLWIIPWVRPSTAYGYSQALKTTWKDYQSCTGNSSASRSDFPDTVNFIGWYGDCVSKKCGISTDNAYAMYLAYHEGIVGYQTKSYLKKPWLIEVAHKVSRYSTLYQRQLNNCKDTLKKKRWWN